MVYYVLYKGDDPEICGTRREVMKYMGWTRQTWSHYRKNYGANNIFIVKVDV